MYRVIFSVLSSYVSRFSFYFSLLSCRFFLILFSIVSVFFFCQYYTFPPLSFFNFLFQRYFCHVSHFFHYFIIFICFFHFYVSPRPISNFPYNPTFLSGHTLFTNFSLPRSGHSYPALWIYHRICIFVSFLFFFFRTVSQFFFVSLIFKIYLRLSSEYRTTIEMINWLNRKFYKSRIIS